jgi:hypothetical protein
MHGRVQLCSLFLLAALVGMPDLCQGATAEKHTDVLILCIDQPTRPFARELLEGIQQSVRDAIGLSVFVEFLGPTALESEEVAGQRRKLLAARYAGRPIGIVLAIGDRAVPEADKLRNNFFPSANLLFLISSRGTVRNWNSSGGRSLCRCEPVAFVAGGAFAHARKITANCGQRYIHSSRLRKKRVFRIGSALRAKPITGKRIPKC